MTGVGGDDRASPVGLLPAGDAGSARVPEGVAADDWHPADRWPHSVQRPNRRGVSIAVITFTMPPTRQATGSPQPISKAKPNPASMATADGHHGFGRYTILRSPAIVALRTCLENGRSSPPITDLTRLAWSVASNGHDRTPPARNGTDRYKAECHESAPKWQRLLCIRPGWRSPVG